MMIVRDYRVLFHDGRSGQRVARYHELLRIRVRMRGAR